MNKYFNPKKVKDVEKFLQKQESCQWDNIVRIEKTIEKWIRQARHDLEMAIKNKKIGGYDTCAMLCQQSVEKYLKALYIKKNKKAPPKIHHLDKLANILEIPENLKSITYDLSTDYILSRYPDVNDTVPYEEYTDEIASEKIKNAKKIVNWIKKELEK